jgi:hypothetical protein
VPSGPTVNPSIETGTLPGKFGTTAKIAVWPRCQAPADVTPHVSSKASNQCSSDNVLAQ